MFGLLKRLWRDRRGNALVIAGAALPLVVGSAGLATDTVEWAMWKRQLQRAADSGALAGALGKLSGQSVATGACSANAAVSRDLAVGTVNTRLGTTPTCNVKTGSDITNASWQAASSGAVQVIVSTQRRLPFSSLFMSTTPTITATAIAAAVQTGKYCVVSLDNNSETGLKFSGSATVNLGCGLKTNAKGSSAVDGTGSSTVTASPVAAVGQIANSGNFASGTTFQPYSAPQADPYASVPAPTSFPNGNCPNFSVNSNQTKTSLSANSDYKLTSDGYYCMGNMSLNGNVTLPSGVYVLDAGSLSIGSQAVVNCSGCTFVFTSRTAATNPGSIGGISNINGGATINMTAPSSGTYSGLLMYQDRRATLPNGNQSNQVNGNSSSTFQGSFYFPSQRVTFNGTSGMTTNCVQMVGWQVTFTGNTTINNVCPGGPGGFDGTMVRLVA
jgi:Flp pilus assembly protein TadG